jgi:hypothetical protein
METFDVCVLLFTGLTTGMSIGLAIRTKQVNRLRDQIDAADGSYARLLEVYMERFYEQSVEKTRPAAKKRGPGRPKGSTTKAKQDGKPTTRKYTRKTSK